MPKLEERKQRTSTNQLNRRRWISEFSAYEFIYGSRGIMEFRRITGAAHLRRGKNSLPCKVYGGAAAGSSAYLSADHPAGVSWSFGGASGVPQGQRVPRAARTTCVFRSRRGPRLGSQAMRTITIRAPGSTSPLFTRFT